MGEIINFQEYLEDNEVLFDPIIWEDCYLMQSFKNALERLGYPETKNSIQEIQLEHNLSTHKSHNFGIVDPNTYIAIINLAFDEEVSEPIIRRLERNIKDFNDIFVENDRPKTLWERIKRIFKNK